MLVVVMVGAGELAGDVEVVAETSVPGGNASDGVRGRERSCSFARFPALPVMGGFSRSPTAALGDRVTGDGLVVIRVGDRRDCGELLPDISTFRGSATSLLENCATTSVIVTRCDQCKQASGREAVQQCTIRGDSIAGRSDRTADCLKTVATQESQSPHSSVLVSSTHRIRPERLQACASSAAVSFNRADCAQAPFAVHRWYGSSGSTLSLCVRC
jgi:hypothetical protein